MSPALNMTLSSKSARNVWSPLQLTGW